MIEVDVAKDKAVIENTSGKTAGSVSVVDHKKVIYYIHNCELYFEFK